MNSAAQWVPAKGGFDETKHKIGVALCVTHKGYLFCTIDDRNAIALSRENVVKFKALLDEYLEQVPETITKQIELTSEEWARVDTALASDLYDGSVWAKIRKQL